MARKEAPNREAIALAMKKAPATDRGQGILSEGIDMKIFMIVWATALIVATAILSLKAIPTTEAVAQSPLANSSKTENQAAAPPSSSSLERLMWMKHEDALAVVKLLLESKSYEERKETITPAALLVTYHDAKCQKLTGKGLADDQLYFARLVTEAYPQITAMVAAPWLKIIDGAGTNGPIAFCLVMNEWPDVQRFMKKSN
jgi:hypothetical protein